MAFLVFSQAELGFLPPSFNYTYVPLGYPQNPQIRKIQKIQKSKRYKNPKIQKIQKSIKSNGIPGVQSSRTWFSSNDLQPLWVAMPFVFLFVFWGEIRKMLTNKKWKKIHSLSCGRIKELAKKVQNYTKGLWYLRLFRSYF